MYLDWLAKMDWKALGPWSFGIGALATVAVIFIINYFKGSLKRVSIEMQKPSPTDKDIIMELVKEVKSSNEENKEERAVIIRGLSASLEWISKQPGANGRIADARSRLEDWLLERGLQ